MKIKFVNTRQHRSVPQAIKNKTDYRGNFSSVGTRALPPMWGQVEKLYRDSTVDVVLHNGIQLHRVGVPASEYVSVRSGSAVGGKKMPPVGSKVLVVFPDGIIDNAFIIASRLDIVDPKEKTALLATGEERIDKTITEAGWTFWYNQENGKYEVESEGGFLMTIDPVEKVIDILDWNGNTFVMNSAGINLNGNLEVLR